jgi:acyl transferase domain-containing protein/acyl carrier protein
MEETETTDLSNELAIIGMAGRFPQAPNVEQFWEKLRTGKELISFFTDEELIAEGATAQLLNNPSFVKAGGVMQDIDLFDASFFGYTPREAEMLDPQQRIFLECAWEALENAGYDPYRYSGSIGVFAGCSISNYFLQNLTQHPELLDALGNFQLGMLNDKDYLATRTSYKLNLRGPSISVQTACSTSLVAIHLACQSVLNGECDMALAGGVSISLLKKMGYFYQEGGIYSPDGHCRTFDAQAQGMVGGNGVGVVVIKRLEDTLADRDNILALIKGSAVNNDGALKIGYTAPSVDGQAKVIAAAQAVAGVDAGTITYVEAHGTATNLGDPVEVAALTKAFRVTTGKKRFCGIGSVKTNLGHLDTAAGVAGVIKTVLSLQHKCLPPSLHFQTPNPHIDFESSPFYVVSKSSEWVVDSGPRRAAVSSFGIGGTNAHVILEEAPEPAVCSAGRPWQLLLLSAKTLGALEAATKNLAEYLKTHTDINLADVAYTLQVGRRNFEYRRAVVCRDPHDAVDALERLDPRRVSTGSAKDKKSSVAFMFTGQGSQYPGMAAGLYEHEPMFRRHVDRCSELLLPHLRRDLRDTIYPRDTDASEAAKLLTETSVTQPSLFVIEYALAQLLMSWGIQPVAMIGHSIGEYVAACLAGVFSLEDALSLVAERGRLMQQMPAGAMLSVRLTEDEVRPFLDSDLCLAAVNAPNHCVVSGPIEAIDALEKKITAQKLDCTRLHTSHAFHSEMMRPVLAPFTESVRAFKRSSPSRRFVSNLTGRWITPEQATDPGYWAMHLAKTVRFAEGVQALKETGAVLLEVGPGQTLSTLARQQLHGPAAPLALSTLRRPSDTAADHEFLLNTLGRLWLAGVDVDWQGFYTNERRRRLPLPAYPFERERYWLEPQAGATTPRTRRSQPGKLPDVADWVYAPAWKQLPPRLSLVSATTVEPGCCLFFADEGGLASLIATQLAQTDHEVIEVRAAEQFTKFDDKVFGINPASSEDYELLIRELGASKRIPRHVLHLWNAKPIDLLEDSLQSFHAAKERGFYSLLFLARALEKSNVSESLLVVVVTANTQDVSGGERFSADRSTVLAACTVIPQEYPNIRCRSIDIDLDNSSNTHLERLATHLISELGVPSTDMIVAYRGSQRWSRTYEAVRFDQSAPIHLRQQGVYLIAGSGKFSSTLAEYLNRTVQANIEWARETDLADVDQMRRVLQSLKKRFGKVHGVFYTGIVDAPEPRLPIGEASRAEIDRRFQNTLQPLFVLEEALHEDELDFCLLMSTLSSVLGGLGLSCAVAQGVFADAFAARQNQTRSVPWISIDWDRWQAPDDTNGNPADAGITPDEAMEVLGRVLGHPLFTPVIVSTTDLHARIARWISPQPSSDKKEQTTSAASAGHSRPNLANPFVAPRNDLETTLVNIWQSLLGIDAIGIHDNLFDLGGDSLLAIQIISRVRETLHCEIALRSIFETPTIAGLVQGIEQQQQDVDSEFGTINELVDLVEQLSEDELKTLIAEQQGLATKA